MKGIAFAMLPFRAIGDQALTGLDLRVLAAIAWHDRGSRPRGKGQGCWAGNQKLAQEVGCDYTNLSSSITKLGTLGYVERTPHPINKKLRIYRVIYDSLPTDKEGALPTDKPELRDDTEPSRLKAVSSPVATTRETASLQPIVCQGFGEGERRQRDTDVEYIPRSGEQITRKSARNSVETARNSANVGASLFEIESTIKRGDLSPHQVEELIAKISDVVDECGDFKDPNFQYARRLFSALERLRTQKEE